MFYESRFSIGEFVCYTNPDDSEDKVFSCVHGILFEKDKVYYALDFDTDTFYDSSDIEAASVREDG